MQDNKINYVITARDEASGKFVKMSKTARESAREIQAALNGTTVASSKTTNASGKLDGEQKKLAKSTDQVAQATNRASKAQQSYFVHIAKTTVQSALVNKAFLVMVDSIGQAVERADLLNNFPGTMEALGQSADEASVSMNHLTGYISKVGGDLSLAANSVTRFSEVTNNVKLATKEFQAVNNALIAGGAGSQVQKNALEQLTQAYSRGLPQLIEWRSLMIAMPAQLNQVAQAMDFKNAQELGEALTGGLDGMPEEVTAALKAVVKKMKLTGFGELGRNLAEGLVVPDEFKGAIDAAVKAMGLNNAQELGQQLSGVSVSMQDFMDTLTQLATGTGPIVAQTQARMKGLGFTFNVIKNEIIQATTDIINTIGSQNIANAAKFLSLAFVSLFKGVMFFVNAVRSVFDPTVQASLAIRLLGRAIIVGATAWAIYRTAMLGSAIITGIVALAMPVLSAMAFALSSGLGAATAAQIGLNVAMTANPIGLVITAVVALGSALVWLLNKIEPIRRFFASIGNWFKGLVGISNAIGDVEGLGEVSGFTAEQGEDLSGALDNVADSARDVGGAVTEATKSLAPFDKMNVLDDNKGGGGGGAFGGMAKSLKKVKEEAVDAREALQSVNQAAKESAQILQPTFNPQITWNPMPETFNPQKTIEAGAIQGSYAWANAFTGTLTVQQPYITQRLGSVITAASIDNYPKTISLGNSTGDLFISSVGNATGSSQSLSVVSSAIRGTLTNSTANNVQNTTQMGLTTGNTYSQGASVGIQNNEIKLTDTISNTITAATDNSMPLTVDNGQRSGATLAQETVQEYKDISGVLWPSAGKAATSDIFKMLNMVVPTAQLMGDNVGQTFINAINQNTNKGVSNFDKALNTMYYLARTGDWAGAFAVMGQALKYAMDDAIGAAMRGIKEMWNTIARAANRGILVNINAAKWGPIDLPGVNVKATIGMPYLAKGGIVNGPTPAMIGEDGSEAVIPLERNTEWMDKLAEKINSATGSSNGQPLQLTVQIGEENIASTLIDLINEKTQMSGRNAILV